MADSTLAAIIKKVRRLTRSPSDQQITDADITEYVNTFIQYDFPQELRLDSLRKTLTFYTEPYIDTYETNTTVGDPLYNFKNLYTGVHGPVYVAGYPVSLSQSEAEFYGWFSFRNSIKTEAAGDGVTLLFSGTFSAVPILRNKVTFNSIDVSGNTLTIYDDGDGVLAGNGAGTIDYETGAWSITFTTAPASGQDINSLTVPYTPGRPQSILYFDSKFVVRPVPDQSYPVQLEVDVLPSELLSTASSPDLEQWWQYIAYGAAKKIFEDKSDVESVQDIMPEFKHQELLVLRKTLVNQSKERIATIYSQGASIKSGCGWPFNGSNN